MAYTELCFLRPISRADSQCNSPTQEVLQDTIENRYLYMDKRVNYLGGWLHLQPSGVTVGERISTG